VSLLIILVVAILVVTIPQPATPQGTSDPCGLLTDADLESVLGVKVTRHIGQGDLKTPNQASCSWVTATPAQRGRLAAGRVREGARVQNKDFVQQVTQLGWKVEVADDSPALWCGRFIPPPNDKGQTLPGPGAKCEGVMKGFYVSLEVYSPKATAAQVKGLLDKLSGRLPA
jgi:hypothetical protein